ARPERRTPPQRARGEIRQAAHEVPSRKVHMHPSNTSAADAVPAGKPSRTRAAATALATTVGAAAVMTTAFAAPADAQAHRTVWDKVAKCESGQRWHI